MLNSYFRILNTTIAAIVLLMLLVGAWVWLSPVEDTETMTPSVGHVIPKNPFEQKSHSYEAIGDPFLSLQYTPPQMELPNLQPHLSYHGTNKRPDADAGVAWLHFSLKGDSQPASVAAGEPLYLRAGSGGYTFSPNNEETSLWMTAEGGEGEAVVKVRMRNDEGVVVDEPASYATFTVKEKEFLGWRGGKWQLGELRVDGTLLARQRARWYGEDVFLDKHGGEAFTASHGKQRVDFGEGEEAYYAFVQEGDCLIWDGSRWRESVPGEESRRSPLLCVKKIADKIMNLELWDVGGNKKMPLNLIKSTEVWFPKVVEQDLKFVGARTRTQSIVELKGERMTLRPQDWLVMTSEGWKKLSTEKDIDDYVGRKTVGPLFVFRGIEKKGGIPYLLGTLYSPARTVTKDVELAVHKGTSATKAEEEEDVEDIPVVPKRSVEPVPMKAPDTTKEVSHEKS